MPPVMPRDNKTKRRHRAPVLADEAHFPLHRELEGGMDYQYSKAETVLIP